MKPLIGITMNLDEQVSRSLNILDQDYGKAVLQAGGIPVPLLGIQPVHSRPGETAGRVPFYRRR